jgi:hypothetical protein
MNWLTTLGTLLNLIVEVLKWQNERKTKREGAAEVLAKIFEENRNAVRRANIAKLRVERDITAHGVYAPDKWQRPARGGTSGVRGLAGDLLGSGGHIGDGNTDQKI